MVGRIVFCLCGPSRLSCMKATWSVGSSEPMLRTAALMPLSKPTVFNVPEGRGAQTMQVSGTPAAAVLGVLTQHGASGRDGTVEETSGEIAVRSERRVLIERPIIRGCLRKSAVGDPPKANSFQLNRHNS